MHLVHGISGQSLERRIHENDRERFLLKLQYDNAVAGGQNRIVAQVQLHLEFLPLVCQEDIVIRNDREIADEFQQLNVLILKTIRRFVGDSKNSDALIPLHDRKKQPGPDNDGLHGGGRTVLLILFDVGACGAFFYF